jgi:hypothetical protein
MARLKAKGYKKYTNAQLLFLLRFHKVPVSENERTKSKLVSKAATRLDFDQATLDAFWARSNVQADQRHPNNLPKRKSRRKKNTKDDNEDEEGEEEDEDESADNRYDDEDNHVDDEGENIEEDSNSSHPAEAVGEELEVELEEELASPPKATSTDAANTSDNNGATSSELASSGNTLALTDPAPSLPSDNKAYTEIKQEWRKVFARIQAEADAMKDSEDLEALD